MKKTWISCGFVLLLVLSIAQFGLAQPGDGEGRGFGRGQGMCQERGFGHGDGPGILAKAETLELTADQISKIRTMRLESAKETVRLRSDLELKQLELQELLAADTPDMGRIEAKIDEMAPLKTMLQKKRIEQHLATRNVLTTEQKEKLQLLRGADMHRKRGPRNGHRGSQRG